ncbi:hypothetical protein MICAD_3240013 [Microcystis aeruginosa PCC 7941]|nr:hypothetical protein MICAD_3240013 [Microcystis aeruginosa PCC 7941]
MVLSPSITFRMPYDSPPLPPPPAPDIGGGWGGKGGTKFA